MIRTIAIGRKGAAEIRGGEAGHRIGNAQLDCCRIKAVERVGDVAEQERVLIEQIVVQIKAAN